MIFDPTLAQRVASAIAVIFLCGQASHASPDSILDGETLTPVGAERAGNAAGTIPAWTGGLTKPPEGWNPGDRLVDPYAEDPILFTINAENQQEYGQYLTEGQKALLGKYPDTWYMNIYATRRSAAFPQAIYEALAANAGNAQVIAEGRGGVANSVVSSPFPVPSSGLEVIWNHNLRWRGVRVNRMEGSAAVTRRGRYTLILQEDDWAFPYGQTDTGPRRDNVLLAYKSKVIGPGFLSGGGLLTVDSLNHNETARENWLYSPDLRRVLRAPFSGFDNPAPNTDALRFTDEGDMFNGAPGLFDWKLLGKREMYIPYNAYALESAALTAAQLVGEEHIDPTHVRYELHRVWVVEGTLRTGDGQRGHQYSRRVFYVDEDSWQIAAADNYDRDGRLWRVSEGHMVNFYEMPVPWYALRVYHDLREDRFLVQGLDNQRRATTFSADINPRLFGPSALSFYVR